MFSTEAFSLKNIPIPVEHKNNRHGQARVLNAEELAKVIGNLPDERWQMIFAIAYFTGSRISEVLKLERQDLTELGITFRASNTKTKETRQASYHPSLKAALDEYPLPELGYLFPGHHNSKNPGHVSRQAADKVLRDVTECLELQGVSTHSFRRSFVTNMYLEGYTLNEIQRFTGHKSLKVLSGYAG